MPSISPAANGPLVYNPLREKLYSEHNSKLHQNDQLNPVGNNASANKNKRPTLFGFFEWILKSSNNE